MKIDGDMAVSSNWLSKSLTCLVFLAVLAGIVISGCAGAGGGTEGTGFKSIQGAIVENGVPVAGSTVTIEETGDSAVTDEQGRFSIDSVALDISESQVTLRVEDQRSFSAVTQISNIPNGEADVVVSISINRARNQATVTSISIVTPTPTPRVNNTAPVPATQPPGPSPIPTSSIPEPTSPAGQTPTPRQGVTVSPTPSRTPTPTCSNVIVSDPCILDLDDSGNVNVADNTRAIQLYAANDPRIDLDQNGVVNICDLDVYSASINVLGPHDCPAHYTPTPTPTP